MVLDRLSWRVTCSNNASFQSLDSHQRMLLWTHKEVALAPHPDVGLVLKSRCEEISSGSWTRKPGSFSRSQQASSNSRRMGLVRLELACEADRLILFHLAVAAFAGAVLTYFSAEKVPSMHNVAPR